MVLKIEFNAVIEKGVKEGWSDERNFKFRYVENSVKVFIQFVVMWKFFQNREKI